MKTNYFTKVENKYVFNLSLIFWHFFIALATLTMAASIVLLIWSVMPVSQKKVEKEAYPEKSHYPEPVQVSLSELNLEVTNQEEAPPAPEQTETTATQVQQVIEDTKGIADYDASLNTLKNLIPPSKYSWSGAGYWSYPYGERYWTYYKQEKYRQWNTTEAGVEDKLKTSYQKAHALNYSDKKQLLDGYIAVVKSVAENQRLSALQNLMSNASSDITQNINTCLSIAKVSNKIPNEENMYYIYQLALFGKKNPTDGSPFIDYISTIIDKFNVKQQTEIISNLINSYYNYFTQNLAKQKEATDLFIPYTSQIQSELQSKALLQYYGLYLSKNKDRDNTITQIENEYQQKVTSIDNQYNLKKANAMSEYQVKKSKKSDYRYKSLMGIGGGIVMIVLITSILVFLSIQRSVKTIEESITAQKS